LNDGDKLGLTDFETYYTILNVNLSNNKFYFDKDDKEIVIPEESYELFDIHKYLKPILTRTFNCYHEKKDIDDDKIKIKIKTMRASTR